MSYTIDHGKDKVIFLTKEELSQPSKIVLPEGDEPKGFLLSNGEINWGCPCLGNAAVGPCSVEFRESLSCFHTSTADPKGSDCLREFREMNDCMTRYPSLYKRDEENDSVLESLEENQEIREADRKNSDEVESAEKK